jgi:hypothetical protein
VLGFLYLKQREINRDLRDDIMVKNCLVSHTVDLLSEIKLEKTPLEKKLRSHLEALQNNLPL